MADPVVGVTPVLDGESGGDSDAPTDGAYVNMLDTTTTEETYHHLQPGKSPMSRVVGNFVNTVVGAGIVGLPFALKRAGFFAGLGLMCLACALSHYSLRLLIRMGIQLRVHTFEGMCEKAFGRAGYYTVAACLLVFDYGACLSYLIILADSLSRVVAQLWPQAGHHDGALRDVCLLLSCPLLLLLCSQRCLSALEHVGFTSVAIVALLALYVAWHFFSLAAAGLTPDAAADATDADAPLSVISPGIGAAFGTFAFAFVNDDCAFLLFNTLERPTERRWVRLCSVSLAIALAICALFAAFGYLSFGERVDANLLNSFGMRGAPILLMRAGYALSMVLTFPSTFFVVRHICNELCFSHRDDHATVLANSTARHLLLTLSIFGACLAPALAHVTLSFVMSFTGGLAAVVLAFVLPPAAFIKCNQWSHSAAVWRNTGAVGLSLWRLGPAMAMLAFGVVAALLVPAQVVACEFGPADARWLDGLC